MNGSCSQVTASTSSLLTDQSNTLERSTDSSILQSQHLSSASSYADLNLLFNIQDPAMLATKSRGNRKKGKEGSDHTKHRRTRSGCYTCRSRRVKCDEAKPICERCRKGGRDCVYPEASSSSKPGSSKRTSTVNRASPSSSSEDDDDGESERLEAIPDEEETPDLTPNPANTIKPGIQRSSTGQSTSGQRNVTRHGSETPSLVQDRGTPSSTSDKSDWSHLPGDLHFYLTYFYDNINHLHYSLKYDPDEFMRTQFLDAAMSNEALLYAVVGFSAFQRTLHNPDGKMQDFLQYYNKAVSLLLRSLKKGERHSTGTLLAILQLATIEEFLGDWVNLLGHQKAAYQILTHLYTPQSIMQNEMSRIILGWYIRFDVFAGLMGGIETVLSREWFRTAYEFSQQQIQIDPNSLKWKIEGIIAHNRLLATDMSLLYAKMGRGELSPEEFMRGNAEIGKSISDWKAKLDPALQDTRYTVSDFTGARPRDPNSIVDPYLPGIVYQGPLQAMNITIIDWYSVDLMHRYQTALATKNEPGPELPKIALSICQLFEALEFWPGSLPGTILACQASLAIACLFLPRDDRHSMWARRKLAVIESHGYIYPYTFRTKMADLFRDRSCMYWWLPNGENYPPIIRSIRKFVEDRTAPAKDIPTEDVRDMKAIFASLNLNDEQPSITPSASKAMAITAPVKVASEGSSNLQDLGAMIEETDGAIGLGFNSGRVYWDEGRGP